jgi:ribulose-5-phosphate 4-epimerase/fuculose-1-phosphate aldolase
MNKGRKKLMDNMAELKETLYEACRMLIKEDLTRFGLGHLAVRIPGRDQMIIPGHLHDMGRRMDHITREDMVMIDFDGKVLEGIHPKSMGEFHMYSAVFRRRPEIQACLHAHPFYALTLMATKSPLLPVSRDGCLFWDGVPYYERHPLYVGDRAHGEAMAECLGNKKALFHRGHGVLVVGRSIKEAFIRTIVLESACKIQVTAASVGNLVSFKPEEIAESHKELDKDWIEEMFSYLRTRSGL